MTLNTDMTAVAPGRVLSLGYNHDIGGSRYTYPWLYVIAVIATETGPSFYGVVVDNSGGSAASQFATITLEEVTRWVRDYGTTLGHYALGDFGLGTGSVPGQVARFLADPASFPGGVPALPDARVSALEERIAGMERDQDRLVRERVDASLTGETVPLAVIRERLHAASEVASQYANDNSLCGEFERCMEAIGLQDWGLESTRERERQYVVTYTREVETTCDHCGSETTETERDSRDVWITSRTTDDALDIVLEYPEDYLPGWDGDSDDVDLERVA